MFVVAVQMMHPTTLTSINRIICIPRSFVFPDVHVTKRDTKKVATQTGAVISKVSIFP